MPRSIVTSFLAASLAAVAVACAPPLAPSPSPAPTSAPAKAPTTAASAPVAAPATSAPAPRTTAPKPSDELAEAARREGSVVIYASGEAAAWEPIKQAWSARYPGVNLEIVNQRGRDTREKIIAEQAAKRVVADVVSAGPDSTTELDKLGFLDPFQPAELSAIRADFVDPRGILLPRNVNVYGITVNTRLLAAEEQPKRWADLVDPKYRGRITMQDPRGSGGGLTVFTALLKVHGESYLRKLSEQQIVMGSQTAQIRTALIRGEHAILLTDTAEGVSRAVAEGAPLRFIRPEEGVAVTPISVTVVKNAPHPNAAKLFANWVLSQEGQTAVAASGATPVRTGVPVASPEYSIDGVALLPRDDQESGPERAAELTKLLEDIFFK